MNAPSEAEMERLHCTDQSKYRSEYADSDFLCTRCGKDLEKRKQYCPKCGYANSPSYPDKKGAEEKKREERVREMEEEARNRDGPLQLDQVCYFKKYEGTGMTFGDILRSGIRGMGYVEWCIENLSVEFSEEIYSEVSRYKDLAHDVRDKYNQPW